MTTLLNYAKKTQSLADIATRLEITIDEMQYSKEQRKMFREIEKQIGVKRGLSMSTEKADKQSANPKYAPGNNYSINCQTCAPAFMLRRWGFNVTAKPNTAGSLSEYLSRGHFAETWTDLAGNGKNTVRFSDYMIAKGWKSMNKKRYYEYFNDVCKEDGIYELALRWKGSGGGHCTIVLKENGKLYYVEPQVDCTSSNRDFDWLIDNLSSSPRTHHGVVRIDNALLNMKFVSIFNK